MGKSACVHVDGADGKAWVPLSQYKKESLNLISDGISGILIDGEARIVDPDLFTTDLISVQGIDFLLIPNGNLLKLPESQKLQDSYTNTDKKQTQKETEREKEREREVHDFEQSVIRSGSRIRHLVMGTLPPPLALMQLDK
jgi:hypothetical protein